MIKGLNYKFTATYEEDNTGKHHYYLNGVELISCTNLLKKHNLAPKYDAVDDEKLTIASEYGKFVHRELELFIKKDEVSFAQEQKNFEKWYKDNAKKGINIVFVESEMKVNNDLVGGSIDLIYEENEELVIADFKTTSQVHKEAVSWQLSIYRELSGAFLDVVRAQNDLFTFEKMDRVPAEKYEQKKLYEERFGKGADAYNNASTQLHRSAPFIEENIFEQFRNILRDVRRQLLHYPAFYIEDDALETQRECQTLFEECTKRTQTINDEMDKLISDLREYLKKLDVA